MTDTHLIPSSFALPHHTKLVLAREVATGQRYMELGGSSWHTRTDLPLSATVGRRAVLIDTRPPKQPKAKKVKVDPNLLTRLVNDSADCPLSRQRTTSAQRSDLRRKIRKALAAR